MCVFITDVSKIIYCFQNSNKANFIIILIDTFILCVPIFWGCLLFILMDPTFCSNFRNIKLRRNLKKIIYHTQTYFVTISYSFFSNGIEYKIFYIYIRNKIYFTKNHVTSTYFMNKCTGDKKIYIFSKSNILLRELITY